MISPSFLKCFIRVAEVDVSFVISARTVYCLLDKADLQVVWIRSDRTGKLFRTLVFVSQCGLMGELPLLEEAYPAVRNYDEALPRGK